MNNVVTVRILIDLLRVPAYARDRLGDARKLLRGVAIDKTVTAGARVLPGLDGLSTYAYLALLLDVRTNSSPFEQPCRVKTSYLHH